MTESNGYSGLHPNNQIAERVRQYLDVFPSKFRELGAPGELRRMVDSHETLSGPRVRQKPERFTEQYLIEPVLHALGYWNPISENFEPGGPHFIRQPSEYRNIESLRPDYKLENVGSSLVCLVEAKAANAEQLDGTKTEASDDIEAYLESDTFCKVLRETSHRFLVGIGTDGLRWKLWTKNLRTGEIKRDEQAVDLSPVVKSVARRQGTLEGDPGSTRPEERVVLNEEFVPAFAARNLESYVRNLWN